MKTESSFIVRKKDGRSGNKTGDYVYLLNGHEVSTRLADVNISFLPNKRPTVTLKIDPKLIEIDADVLLEILCRAEPVEEETETYTYGCGEPEAHTVSVTIPAVNVKSK